MEIHGYNQLTLLDYPGKLGAMIFCGGCNFRCPFCHNASLVLHKDSQPRLDPEKIISHLKLRRGTLEGVCISGGEPTLQKDLPEFIKRIKDETGLAVKLDTNGYRPGVLQELLEKGLLDYIAMDIKASPSNYPEATGINDFSMSNIFESIEMIMNSGLDYEFRTTVVDGLHTGQDFTDIGRMIKGADAYYLQAYKDSGDVISPKGFASPPKEKIEEYLDIVRPYVKSASLRGQD